MVSGSEKSTLLAEWIAYHQQTLSKKTMEMYTPEVRKLLNVIDDSITITTRGLIALFQRVTEHDTLHTKHTIFWAWRNFFRWLERVEYREDNPALKMPKVKIPFRRKQVISEETVKMLLIPDTIKNAVLDQRDTTMILCMLDCGLRISEVTSLMLSDVLEEELRIIGKGNKERFVPMSKRVLENLRIWIDHRWMYKPKVDNVFISAWSGSPMLTSNLVKMIQGRGNTHPHALRRYFATKLVNNGVDIYTIKELLGHSSVTTTELYIDMDKHRIQNEYRRVIG